MENAHRLADQRALITGAGTGIGREIAVEFARQGAHVALHYAHSAEGADSATQAILSSATYSSITPELRITNPLSR